jgi:hypothetical protein
MVYPPRRELINSPFRGGSIPLGHKKYGYARYDAEGVNPRIASAKKPAAARKKQILLSYCAETG